MHRALVLLALAASASASSYSQYDRYAISLLTAGRCSRDRLC